MVDMFRADYWQMYRVDDFAVANFGAVSEWLKEAVLKTVEPQGSGGSNPPCSEQNEKLGKTRACQKTITKGST